VDYQPQSPSLIRVGIFTDYVTEATCIPSSKAVFSARLNSLIRLLIASKSLQLNNAIVADVTIYSPIDVDHCAIHHRPHSLTHMARTLECVIDELNREI
jgi:hypothetical protein